MWVDGGANFHYFWDKHLFYVLFVIPTSVHVSGGYNLSADCIVMVPVMLPGYMTLHSLVIAYWTPTYRTNTLSISDLNLYRIFLGTPMKPFHHATSATLKATNFLSKQLEKKSWLNQPSGNQYRSITSYIPTPPFLPKHHLHELQPKCYIHPKTLWTWLPSAHSTDVQPWDIHRTTKVYPQTLPPLPCLYYYQGTPLTPSSQCIHRKPR